MSTLYRHLHNSVIFIEYSVGTQYSDGRRGRRRFGDDDDDDDDNEDDDGDDDEEDEDEYDGMRMASNVLLPEYLS